VLATGEKHGYEIMKQVKQDGLSLIKMGTGTRYGSLKRMLADRLIEEAGEKPDPTRADERRLKKWRRRSSFSHQSPPRLSPEPICALMAVQLPVYKAEIFQERSAS
jgi:DNA-binding PadR family transcriptional regulator